MNSIIRGKRYASKATGFLIEVTSIDRHGVSYGWVDIKNEVDHTVVGHVTTPEFHELFEDVS